MYIGHHYQNAYVTRDLEMSLAQFRRRGDIRLESGWEGKQTVMTPAGPVTMHNKLAFIWVGDLQYELIEPVSGMDLVYRHNLPDAADGTLGFNHICQRVPDWDVLQQRIADQDMPILFEGDTGFLKFLYLDARPQLGHFLEFTCMSDEMWAATGGR